jgi:2'-5' RNA ligase
MSSVLFQAPLFFPTQDTVSSYEYIVVINPDSNTSADIRLFKNKVWEMIGDYPSRYSQPHITIHNFLGFRQKEAYIVDALQKACEKIKASPIYLDGFSSFPESGTIYLVPKPKIYFSDLLRSLYPKLFDCNGINRQSSIYSSTEPHITIARGLKKEEFDLVWPYFEDRVYQGSFVADSLILLRKELSRKATFELVGTFYLSTDIPRVFNLQLGNANPLSSSKYSFE